MSIIKADQRKLLARELYTLGNYTFEEIAAKVGAQRQTISRWARDGKWDEYKNGLSITREEILKRMYSQLQNLNNAILERERDNRKPDSKEADVMVKLAAAIKSMENDVGVADIISVGMRFGEWIRKVDLDKAKEFVRLWDAFLKDSIK